MPSRELHVRTVQLLYCICIVSVNLFSTTHCAKPIRGANSARDPEKIRQSLSSEMMHGGPQLEAMSELCESYAS